MVRGVNCFPVFHRISCPFRTEKLSPIAPMVLHTCGRVGRRRLLYESSKNNISGLFFVYRSFMTIVLGLLLCTRLVASCIKPGIFCLCVSRNGKRWSLLSGVPPDFLSIPHREVKPNRADGTARPRESRSPPTLIREFNQKWLDSFFVHTSELGIRCIPF